MAVPELAVEYTPVRARTSDKVHATTLSRPQETACGRKFRGWCIALKPLNCMECKRALFLDCRKKAER